MITGKITRISGPIVYAEGLEKCGLYDVVDVGNKKLIGEIIRQNEGKATIQVYEEDTGMSILPREELYRIKEDLLNKYLPKTESSEEKDTAEVSA